MPYKDPKKAAERNARYYADNREEIDAQTAARRERPEVKEKTTKRQAKWHAARSKILGPIGYFSWQSMLQRCFDIKHKSYAQYGLLGVKVCERWLIWENFLADMGPRPSAKHSLSRFLDSGSYEPGNVTWAMSSEQGRQKRLKNALILASLSPLPAPEQLNQPAA